VIGVTDVGPMDVYRLLPGDNCGECGYDNCMSFATELLERRADVDDCSVLDEEGNEEDKRKLIELLTPSVRAVEIGSGENSFEIGGEEVMYRHEKTWFNQTATITDVDDEMSDEDIEEKVKWVTNYSREKIGEDLSFDAIAIRGKSGNPDTFGETVEIVKENTDYPIVLCSFDSELLEEGVEKLEGENPLLYGVNLENWKELVNLANENGCPLVLSANDVQDLIELSRKAKAEGLEDDKIVLDFGTNPSNLRESQKRIIELKRAAIEDQFDILRYPLLGVPATSWLVEENENEAAFMEATLGGMMISGGVDALIFHSDKAWSLMPILVLRQDLYQDPRNPANVDSELKEVGDPGRNSPILITTNFALTYYTVEGDCEGLDLYIYPVETGGTSVTASVAGDILTVDKIVNAIEGEGLEEKVDHRTIILPGPAAVLAGGIEEKSDWNVMVGSQDSSGIKKYLEENWPPN